MEAGRLAKFGSREHTAARTKKPAARFGAAGSSAATRSQKIRPSLKASTSSTVSRGLRDQLPGAGWPTAINIAGT